MFHKSRLSYKILTARKDCRRDRYPASCEVSEGLATPVSNRAYIEKI